MLTAGLGRASIQRLTNVRYKTNKKILEEIIRVDHAGELGADRIYAGQMAVLGQTSKGPLIKHMWDQEKHHKNTFEDLIQKYRVRPTIMTPIWNVAGFVLGKFVNNTALHWNSNIVISLNLQVLVLLCWVIKLLWHVL